MAEIKLIPGGQQDQTPVSAQSPLKNPWVFFQEYRQDTEPGGTITYYNVFSGVILFQPRIHTDTDSYTHLDVYKRQPNFLS